MELFRRGHTGNKINLDLSFIVSRLLPSTKHGEKCFQVKELHRIHIHVLRSPIFSNVKKKYEEHLVAKALRDGLIPYAFRDRIGTIRNGYGNGLASDEISISLISSYLGGIENKENWEKMLGVHYTK